MTGLGEMGTRADALMLDRRGGGAGDTKNAAATNSPASVFVELLGHFFCLPPSPPRPPRPAVSTVRIKAKQKQTQFSPGLGDEAARGAWKLSSRPRGGTRGALFAPATSLMLSLHGSCAEEAGTHAPADGTTLYAYGRARGDMGSGTYGCTGSYRLPAEVEVCVVLRAGLGSTARGLRGCCSPAGHATIRTRSFAGPLSLPGFAGIVPADAASPKLARLVRLARAALPVSPG